MTKSINDTPLNSAYETDEQGFVCIKSYDLCSEVLKDRKYFSSFYPFLALTRILGVTVFDVEGDNHAHLKSELGNAFN